MRFRLVAIFAAFTMVAGVYSATLWRSSEKGVDFSAYYVAACLVRSNMSADIYDAVDPNTNPQLLLADPSTAFARTARAHGITQPVLYLYPPMLADLIVPLTALTPSAALKVWHVLEMFLIAGLSIVLTRMLKLSFRGSAVLVAAGVLLFRPTLSSIHWGQVSILLAFVMVAGLAFYVGGRKSMAALLFAVAVLIKLEPIIIIVPILAWRDWKFFRGLALWGIILFAAVWAVNGSDALNLYFLHQLPAMSGGNLGGTAFDGNRSLGNIFYVLLDRAHPLASARGAAWIFRVVSVLILCYAGWLCRFKPADHLANDRRFETGLIFLLFICCLSPYSWFYNWAISAPAIVLFCKRVSDGRADTAETALLIALLLSLTTSRFDLAMVTPLLGVALGLIGLYRMRLEIAGAYAGYPIAQLRNVSAF